MRKIKISQKLWDSLVTEGMESGDWWFKDKYQPVRFGYDGKPVLDDGEEVIIDINLISR